MSEWRTGKFRRDELGFFKRFAPIRSIHSLADITAADIKEMGKSLVLVDVDNTLVEWRSENIPDSTVAWIESVKEAGLKVCIISNTKRVERLKRLGEAFNIPFLYGKFKPSRKMFLQALEMFHAAPEEAIMIGDQIFTDVFGANRSGIDAVWVKQMAPVDFVGTRLSRLGERYVRRKLLKVLDEDKKAEAEEEELADLPIGGTAAFELLRSPVVRQFLKFCIIGGTSFLIDLGIFWYLKFYARSGDVPLREHLGQYLLEHFPTVFSRYQQNPEDAASILFKVLSTSVATINSFVWNRRWTFNIKGKEHRSIHFRRFIILAIMQLVLNAALYGAFYSILPGSDHVRSLAAFMLATIIVLFFNFFGQRIWAFRHRH